MRSFPEFAAVRVRIFLLAPVLICFGCANQALEQRANQYGFSVSQIPGKPFVHRVARAPGQGSRLHVYIEGDGRAWHTPRRVALDPTPRNPLALHLMALDRAPRLYLARPCYFQTRDRLCSPRWWTADRYSEKVIESMNRALDSLVSGEQLVLIGHSGGGTIAMLIAGRRTDVAAVVTIAGNLDTDAWTRSHGFSPLTGSLNPALQAPLDSGILQHHYLGGDDSRITRAMIQRTIGRQTAAKLSVVDGMAHSCCWAKVWPEMLQTLDVALAAARSQ